MTLLITVFAAVISTVIWYKKAPDNRMKLGLLSLLYWGAALMWLVDAVFLYAAKKADYFAPPPQEMLVDSYLGLSVVALGLVAWLVVLLVKDPKGAIKNALFKTGQF